jgi:hypothetical protein
MKYLKNPIVELNGVKCVLWYDMDEYKLADCVHATPVEDWERIVKEYGYDVDAFYDRHNIFFYTYDELKECMEELLDE